MSEFTTPNGTKVVIKPDGYHWFKYTKYIENGYLVTIVEPVGIERIYINDRLEFDVSRKPVRIKWSIYD